MERRIVLPGDKVAEGQVNIPYTYYDPDSNARYATLVGLVDETGRYIPIEKSYSPTVGDFVVGIITDVRHAGYNVTLGIPAEGFISSKFLRVNLQLGDVVMGRVKAVERGSIELGEIRRLPPGKIVEFPSAKIPRLIGKNMSMLELLKQHGKGDIVIGSNGYVWISENADIPKVIRAMELISERAHKTGLTEMIVEFFEKEKR
ncbi:MAG: KH domain-containing protein [Candidatus Bilamarchaeaceae archaeon]